MKLDEASVTNNTGHMTNMWRYQSVTWLTTALQTKLALLQHNILFSFSQSTVFMLNERDTFTSMQKNMDDYRKVKMEQPHALKVFNLFQIYVFKWTRI